MATYHLCTDDYYAIGGKSVRLVDISTAASNIKVLSFSRKSGTKARKTIVDSGEYGLNASWFKNNQKVSDSNSSADYHIMNLAYQNGVRQGYFINDNDVPAVNGTVTDGFSNSVGHSIIYYRNGKALFATNVTSHTDSKVTGSTWVQGGAGLFLGNTNWKAMITSEDAGQYLSDADTRRSALAISTLTNRAYLIVCPDNVSVEDFRAAIMKRFQITEGTTDHAWRAILLDGGGSTQLIGDGANVTSTRPVPQILALINKN